MSVQRFLLATLCAGFLTGCAAHVPILDEQGNAAVTPGPVTQNVVHAPDANGLGVLDPAEGELTATATQEKKRKARARKPAAVSSNVVDTDLKKPQGSGSASNKASAQQSDPDPTADRAERVRRKAEEDERRERDLKKTINGICSGC
jgi:hypothetical protein